MSIDFGTDIYEEPLVAKTLLPEDNAEVSLRPHTLAEYIGQTKAKENLSVFIEAARRRTDRKSTRLNSSHDRQSRMPSSA